MADEKAPPKEPRKNKDGRQPRSLKTQKAVPHRDGAHATVEKQPTARPRPTSTATRQEGLSPAELLPALLRDGTPRDRAYGAYILTQSQVDTRASQGSEQITPEMLELAIRVLRGFFAGTPAREMQISLAGAMELLWQFCDLADYRSRTGLPNPLPYLAVDSGYLDDREQSSFPWEPQRPSAPPG
jgi:hypothetical protein